MKKHILSCAIIWAVLCPLYSDADVLLVSGTVVHFASVGEGRNTLTARDDFIQRLSPFDRSARMKVDRAVSADAFVSFVGKNVLPWTEAETKTVEAAIKKLQPLLHALPLSFPSVIQLIKTTGAEEGNAAYTRAEAIVIPNAELAKTPENLEKLICHELFHILSRRNPALREKLYAVIGFAKCNEIAFPPSLASHKITNPDAPRNDHYIRLKSEGRECLAVPILFSTSEKYNVQRGGEFFEYLSFQFLVVTGVDSLSTSSLSMRIPPRSCFSRRLSRDFLSKSEETPNTTSIRTRLGPITSPFSSWEKKMHRPPKSFERCETCSRHKQKSSDSSSRLACQTFAAASVQRALET